MFTIFNFKGGGHIVISNEDLAEPILGYGLTSYKNPETVNPGLKLLLEQYKNEIEILRNGKFSENKTIKEKWDSFKTGIGSPQLKSYTIGDHLISTNWHQGTHYNDSCPIDPNTNIRCLIGCNGVALGMVLDYWGDIDDIYPDGSITHSCWTLGSNTYTINFYDQNYNWNDIGSSLPKTSQFLYHCALATKPCPFTSDETYSSVENVKNAFESYFSFETDGVQNRTSYTSTQWENLLKGEIDNERPVIYAAGSTVNSGHTWIVDGYDSFNHFHCNWGWGNTDNENNFYSLTNLNPELSDTSYYFNTSFKALTGIKPMLGSDFDIAGDNVVCASNELYSVTIPPTANVLWSKSSNLDQVGSNNNLTYIVNEGTSGVGSISATIKNSQGQILLSKSKSVWVGEPDPDDFTISCYDNYGNGVGYTNHFDLCDGERYTFHVDQLYGLPTSHPRYGISDVDFVFDFEYDEVTGGYGWLCIDVIDVEDDQAGKVEITSDCGGYDDEFKLLSFDEDYCGGYYMVISPNPASGEATIAIKSENSGSALKSANTVSVLDYNTEWECEVYSPAQNLKAKKTKIKDRSVRIQTNGWTEGVYTVRVKYKNEILTGKLVVKK